MEWNSELFPLPQKGSEWNSKSFLFHRTAGIPSEITICSVYSVFRRIIFLSEIPNPNPGKGLCLFAARRVFFLFFVARKGIPSYVLFRGMVQNGIPRICIYFGFTERNSLFSPAEWFGTELWEFASIFFHGTEFRVISSSAEGFGTEFREFLFRGTAGIPTEITICSVNSVFRRIIFLSEIPSPKHA